MKSKIYFAKSNRANPNNVMLVREILSRFDVEVVEYSGGAYSHKPMLECDMLVVLPELSDGEEDKDKETVGLGKGLFEQINTFKRTNTNKSDLLIINYVNLHTKEVEYGDIEDMDCADQDDYINYGVIIFDTSYDGDVLTLTDTLENRLGFKTAYSTKGNKSRNRYLIISSK